MRSFIVRVFGFFLLWLAVGYNREGASEIPLFSKNWWVCLALIILGAVIIKIGSDEN